MRNGRRSPFFTSDKNKFHSTLYSPLTSLAHFLPHHFFIKSSTAPLIALTPVRTVDSGTGANSLECGPGSRVPFSLASFNFCASTAPSQNMLIGGFGSSSAYKLKSSLAITGSPGSTFSFPNVRSSDNATRRVSSGSLMVAGTWSGDTSIIGARPAGTPAVAAIPFVILVIDASTPGAADSLSAPSTAVSLHLE